MQTRGRLQDLQQRAGRCSSVASVSIKVWALDKVAVHWSSLQRNRFATAVAKNKTAAGMPASADHAFLHEASAKLDESILNLHEQQ